MFWLSGIAIARGDGLSIDNFAVDETTFADVDSVWYCASLPCKAHENTARERMRIVARRLKFERSVASTCTPSSLNEYPYSDCEMTRLHERYVNLIVSISVVGLIGRSLHSLPERVTAKAGTGMRGSAGFEGWVGVRRGCEMGDSIYRWR